MSQHKLIESYIFQQRFSQALEVILSLTASSINWENCWLILEKLQDNNAYLKVFLSYGEGIPLKYRFKILKELWRDSSTHNDSRIIYGRWKVLIETGNLSEAVKTGKTYINYLLKRKNFQKGLKFFTEYSFVCKVSDDIKISLVNFYLLSGNLAALDEVLQNYDSDMQQALFEYFFVDISGQWKSSQYLFEIVIEGLSKKIEFSNQDINLVREFINLLYEFLIFYPNESFGIFYLLKYALISKNRYSVLKIKEVVGSQQKRLTTHFDYEKDIKAILVALDSMELRDEEDATILANNFDFATDLIHGSVIRENMIKKLERDIAFFSAAGDSKKVNELKHKLKEIDADNTIFFDDEIKQKKELLSMESLPKAELQRILRYPSLEADQIRGILNSLKELEVDNIQHSYRDFFYMIYTFEDLSLCDLFFQFLTPLLPEEPDILLEINLLKIYAYQLLKQPERVISIVDNTLQNFQISAEHLLELNYQKAEALFFMGESTSAKELYNSIERVAPNYRLSSVRIWTLNEK